MKKNHKVCICIFIVLIVIVSVLLLISKKCNIFKEKFESMDENLLDFNSIKNIKGTEIEPYNTFEKMDNPVNSKTVLVQSSVPEGFTTEETPELRDSYYKISTNVVPGQNYKLSSWVATTPDWNGKDDLFNIRFHNKNKRTTALSDKGTTLRELDIGGLKWKFVNFMVKVPEHVTNIMDVFLGYKPKNTEGKRFITGVNMNKSIVGDDEFPNSDKLKLYLNASQNNSYSNNHTYKKFWNDISGNNNNFQFEKDPIWDKNSFDMKDRKIIGPSPKSIGLNNKEFTVSFMSCGLGGDTNSEAILIPGNEEVAFGITIPDSYGMISCEVADKKYSIDQKILTENNTLYTFTYSDKELEVYVNDIKIKTLKTNQVYFNNQSIEINPYRNWNAKLFGLCVFNKKLELKNIKFLNSYFQRKVMDEILQDYHQISGVGKKEIKESFTQNSQFISEHNKNLKNNNCPEISYDNTKNEYFFDIDPKHSYALQSGTSGRKDIGKTLSEANINLKQYFPECPSQETYEGNNNTVNIDSCMFTDSYVKNKEHHPCVACPELINYKNESNTKLSGHCKKSIIAHCSNKVIHNMNKPQAVENICKSFHPLYNNDPKAQEQLLELHDGLLHH